MYVTWADVKHAQTLSSENERVIQIKHFATHLTPSGRSAHEATAYHQGDRRRGAL